VSVAVLSRNSLLLTDTPSSAATSSANPVLARLSRSPPAVASDGMAIPFPVPALTASSTPISAVSPAARPVIPATSRVVHSFRNSALSAVVIRACLPMR
jgi:hypothetical protein